MIAKLQIIAWKDLYTTFKDRNAVLYMFAMPVAISLIIGLAFGAGSDVSIDAVPVGMVNRDQGTTLGGLPVDLGKTLQNAFILTGDYATDDQYAGIHDLIDGTLYTDPAVAQKKVEDGKLAASVAILDSDFTQRALTGSDPVSVQIFYDSGLSIGPSIVRSIVNAITNGMNTVLLAQRIGPAALAQIGSETGTAQAAIDAAAAQFSSQAMTLSQAAPIQLQQIDLQGKTRSFDALQYFAPSMAILFMTFAMAAGATGILEEQRRWTLQRIVTTPTPRWLYLAGKLVGMFSTGVIQMAVLILSTSIIATLMGRRDPVWGSNVIGLVAMILVVVFAGTSLGLLIAALAKTPEQAMSFSSVALFLLGMLGGSFIPIDNLPALFGWLPKLTLNYWGINGFFKLAYESAPLRDIASSLLALAIMGAAFFVVSLWRFNRRLDM